MQILCHDTFNSVCFPFAMRYHLNGYIMSHRMVGIRHFQGQVCGGIKAEKVSRLIRHVFQSSNAVCLMKAKVIRADTLLR